MASTADNPQARRSSAALAAAAFVLPFALYLLTLCPTLYFGDCGELLLAAFGLGVSHGPGYVLFEQLAHPFASLPMGEVAWRLNLFNALVGAACCWLLHMLLCSLGVRRGLALCAALGLAASFTLWEQATKFRVYPSQALLTLLVIVCLEWWRRRDHDPRLLVLAGFATGLGFATHMLVGATAGIWIVYLVRYIRRVRLLPLLAAIAAGLLGLSLYLYYPLRANADPIINWSEPRDWRSFLDVMTQHTYSGKIGTAALGDKAALLLTVLRKLWHEAGPVTPLLALGGLAVLWQRNRMLLLGLATSCLLLLGVRLNYIGAMEHEHAFVYLIPLTMAMLIAAAMAVDWLAALLQSRLRVGAVGALALGCLLFVPPLASNFQRNDLSKHRLAQSYSRALLNQQDRPFDLFLRGDNAIFGTWYLCGVEGLRRDVTPVVHTAYNERWVGERFYERIEPGVLDNVPQGLREDPSGFGWYLWLMQRELLAGRIVYAVFDRHRLPATAMLDAYPPRLDYLPSGTAFRVWRIDEPAPRPAGLEFFMRAGLCDPARPERLRDGHTNAVSRWIGVFELFAGYAALDAQMPADALVLFESAHRYNPGLRSMHQRDAQPQSEQGP
ncbi:MAG: DUF2723 domain-containing protein [Candidatus Alcyoniella australis]|nr:DUF2723 domain-containing protein [Candidatus Alcyoniella australis]